MSFRIVPLFLREWERAPDASSGAWQVWPLAKYRYAADGEARFEAPSVLPVRHLLEFDRHLGHFFRIFEFHRTAGGDRSWRFLWRVVRLDKGPKARYLGVWPLFSVYKREGKAGKSRWQVLKGLIGHERTGAQRRWRILYFVKLGSRATAAEGVARK
jgi:hypothetical protein